jgi:hypothetical protein
MIVVSLLPTTGNLAVLSRRSYSSSIGYQD